MSVMLFVDTPKCDVEIFNKKYPDEFVDWRKPENRLEAFYRVMHTRMMEGDLDHWMAGKIIADYMKLDNEQKAWYCLLFGFSYRNHWAMIALQTFPRIWETPSEEIESWYNDSHPGAEDGIWRIVSFSKDTKWNVRKFPQFVESVKKWADGSLYEKLKKESTVGNTKENYNNLNTKLQKELYGIGRMTAWLTLQTVYEIFDYDIDEWDLQLDNSASWSQYRAMCYLFDKDEYLERNPREPSVKSDMIKYTQRLMEYCNSRSDYRMDIYNVESCLCEYRKTMVGNKQGKVKEFTFWTSNELIYEFESLYMKWEGKNIDWTPYLLGIGLKGDRMQFGFTPEYFKVASMTGLNFNTHMHFSDEPDAYSLLNIPLPNDIRTPALFKSMLDQIPKSVIDDYKDRFEPSKHLRYYDKGL